MYANTFGWVRCTYLSVKKPQTCVTCPSAIVKNKDGSSGVEGRPSWQKPSSAYWQLSSPVKTTYTLSTRGRRPHRLQEVA